MTKLHYSKSKKIFSIKKKNIKLVHSRIFHLPLFHIFNPNVIETLGSFPHESLVSERPTGKS